MPIFILFVGIILVAVGINDKLPDLVSLIKEDFRPTSNVPGFHVWILAIAVAGAVGYIKPLKGFANAFLVLIIVVLILSNGGFFDKFTAAIQGNSNG